MATAYGVTADGLSKHYAAPQPWVPAESGAANYWCYDNRCRGRNHNRCRRRNDNRRSGSDYDRTFIGAASSERVAVKAGATAAFGNGAVEGDD